MLSNDRLQRVCDDFCHQPLAPLGRALNLSWSHAHPSFSDRRSRILQACIGEELQDIVVVYVVTLAVFETEQL